MAPKRFNAYGRSRVSMEIIRALPWVSIALEAFLSYFLVMEYGVKEGKKDGSG